MKRAPDARGPGTEAQQEVHRRQNRPALGSDQAPLEITWPTLISFVRLKGWTTELSPRGRLCLRKQGSVVFGACPGASSAAYAELLERLGHIEDFMARCRGRRA
jgi:hypothetical protein